MKTSSGYTLSSKRTLPMQDSSYHQGAKLPPQSFRCLTWTHYVFKNDPPNWWHQWWPPQSSSHWLDGLLCRPPRPDFQATQERLTRMGEREARGGREQFSKVKTLNALSDILHKNLWQVKQDLEADYLAAFKKTVAQHEGFLKRLASHNILKWLPFNSFLHLKQHPQERSQPASFPGVRGGVGGEGEECERKDLRVFWNRSGLQSQESKCFLRPKRSFTF